MKVETKVVVIRQAAAFSTVGSKEMKVTLVRLPWEPKEEVKEVA